MLLLSVIVTVQLTFAHAYDCLCPRAESYSVHVQPRLADDTWSRDDKCTLRAEYHNGWYSTVSRGKIGFIHESEVSIVQNCGLHDRHARFMFSEMITAFGSAWKLMAAGASVMSCNMYCPFCKCGDPCLDVNPCALCKDILCSIHNQLHGGTAGTSIPTVTKKHQGTTSTHSSTTNTPLVPSTSIASTTHNPPTTASGQATAASLTLCGSSPCLNGGVCIPNSQSYQCYCSGTPIGGVIYAGQRCEYIIDLSKPHKRFIFDTFYHAGSSAWHLMTDGATALTCAAAGCGICKCGVQSCFDYAPCAVCKDLLCHPHKTDSQVTTATSAKPCDSSPCLNGGVCENRDDNFKCFCKNFYNSTEYLVFIGTRCEVPFQYNWVNNMASKTTETPVKITTDSITNSLETTTQSSKQSSTTDASNSVCTPSPCLNGGLCAVTDHGQSYSCYCPSSPKVSVIYTGRRCELVIDLSRRTRKHY